MAGPSPGGGDLTERPWRGGDRLDIRALEVQRAAFEGEGLNSQNHRSSRPKRALQQCKYRGAMHIFPERAFEDRACYYILYTIYYILYTIYYKLCIMYYVLYTVYHIPYTIYTTL